jgi:hypothetical protein
MAWTLVLTAAGTAGITVTAVTTPPSANGDVFESPLLLPSFAILAVLCGLAGWFSPAAGRYWGLAATGPYLIGFWVQVARHPAAPDADFSPLGFILLLILAAVPWGIGYATSAIRRN